MRRIRVYLLVCSLSLIFVDKFFLFSKIRIPAAATVQSAFLNLRNIIHDYSNSVHNHYLETRNLRQENILLKAQVQKLTLALRNSQNEKNDASKAEAITRLKYPKFTPLLAKSIISPNLVNKEQVLLSFDSQQQGRVKVANVVVNQGGVIGQVAMTRSGYATVNFLANPAFKIYVQNEAGTKLLLAGNSNNSMIIRYVNINADLKVGDILYTTGLDNIYPGHLAVAKVVNIERTNNFMTATCQTIVRKDDIDFALILT